MTCICYDAISYDTLQYDLILHALDSQQQPVQPFSRSTSHLLSYIRFGVVVAPCFVRCTLLFSIPGLHDRPLLFLSGLSSALVPCTQLLDLRPTCTISYLSRELCSGLSLRDMHQCNFNR